MVDKDGSFTYSKTEKVQLPTVHYPLSIVPNPAKTQVQLQFAKPLVGKVEIEVSDVSGKVVFTRSLSGAEGNSITISTSKLTAGSYVVKVVSGGEVYSERLAIIK